MIFLRAYIYGFDYKILSIENDTLCYHLLDT